MTKPPGCDGEVVPLVGVTIPAHRDFGTYIALYYSLSLLPLMFACYLMTLAIHSVFLILSSLYIASLTAFNELVLKQIFRQPRPYGTCLTSFGMPSGHSVTSIGFLSWIILEVVFHQPNVSPRRKALVLVILTILLAPIPSSRVVLHDHSQAQVVAGSFVGILCAIGYFCLLHFVLVKRIPGWCDRAEALFKKRLGLRVRFYHDYYTSPGVITPRSSSSGSARNYEQV